MSIFNYLVQEFNRYISEIEQSQKQKRFLYPISHSDPILIKLLSHVSKSGFVILPVPGKPDWNPNNDVFQLERNLALNGINITRAYLFPIRHLLYDPIVQKHIGLDKESGIEVHLLYIGNLLKENRLPHIDSLDIGIWDDEVITKKLVSNSDHSVSELLISCEEEDLEVYKRNLEEIEKYSEILSFSDTNTDHPDLEEPMLATAPVAEFLSKVLCKGNHISEDCSWYHSIWQYLRIFDAVSTPTWHSSFYATALTRVFKSSNKSVSILISGTADYSMLAHVLWTLEKNVDISYKITVLDLCETPLFLCKWYAKLHNTNVEIIAEDIFKYSPSNNFDLIITDAFLTRFPYEDRKKVLIKWKSLLNENGSIVTTVRLGGDSLGIPRKGSEKQSNLFANNIKMNYTFWRNFLSISLTELEEKSKQYASSMTSYSAGQKKDVVNMFSECGFNIIESIEKEVKGELEPTVYLEIHAKK
ncbi:MAG: class I SAM-dependent methyltransferase [Bacteroidetes bacterium]|nr:class I SAM-dependent methyltransferase [Bacteroidota bacterium]MCL5028885.1 class I SAM-dependent methyltransferase [Bacteroidota bacterium]